jgi:hypothetical protein
MRMHQRGCNLKNDFESIGPVYWTLDDIARWIDPLDEVFLLKALQAGSIVATGRRVTHDVIGPTTLGKREVIHAFVWADLIISPYDIEGALCPLEMHREHWRPAWRDVLVSRKQVQDLWLPKENYLTESGQQLDQPKSLRGPAPGEMAKFVPAIGPRVDDQVKEKDKGGRPIEYDWAAVKGYALGLVQKHGTPSRNNRRLPTRSQLVEAILNEWSSKYDQELSESSVRRYVRKWLSEL